MRDSKVQEEDGRQFVLSDDYQGGVRRVYGVTVECAECGKPFFRADRNASNVTCSHSCGKRGNRHPSRNRPQKHPKKSLDMMFSKIIRWRDGSCCECGKSRDLECAHGFSRRYLAVRWDERNAFALCRECHMYYTGHPLEWDEWLRGTWGEDLYDEIRDLALNGRNPDLDEMLMEVRAAYDPMAWERRGE